MKGRPVDPFEMPSELPASVADLNALIEQAQAEFAALHDEALKDGATPTQEQLDRLKYLADSIDTLDGKAAEVTEAEQARRDEAAALLSRVRKPADEDGDPAEDEQEQEDPDASAAGEDAAAAEDEQQVVAASAAASKPPARRSFSGVGKSAGARPADVAPKRGLEVRLAMGSYGYREGAVSLADVAKNLDSMRNGSTIRSNRAALPSSAEERHRDMGSASIASVVRDTPPELRVDSLHEMVAAIEHATDEANLPGESLTAAAGWCSPSERMYDFLDVTPASGLLSMPEVTVNRGGVMYPAEPDFWAVYADLNSFFHYTEAELLADPEPTKPCYEIPCPDDFTEHRLEAIGLCVTAGILQRKGWPESIEAYLKRLLKAHLMRISAASIAKVLASATARAYPAAGTIGAYAAFLDVVEFEANRLRLKEARPIDSTVEGFAPWWLPAAFRADMNYRDGKPLQTLTDEQINADLAARNIRLQWVDWQTRGAGQPGDDAVFRYPATADVALYPAGTYFRALDNVIELGGLYDKAQLQKNRYTELFTEDAFLVGKRGLYSSRVTVPISVNGQVGERTKLGNNTAAVAA